MVTTDAGYTTQVAEDLIHLKDAFDEFSAINAFMSHAFALSLAAHDWLSPDIIAGSRLCANELQLRMDRFKAELQWVQERHGQAAAQAGDRV